jgi:hypothetical protein
MHKVIATLIAVVIVIIAWYLFFGGFSPGTSTNRYKKISILQEERIVCKIDVTPSWIFTTNLGTAPHGIERWRQVILLGQTDYMKFLSDKECANLYGRTEVTTEQIESQRKYVIDKFKDESLSLSVSKIYIVLDTRGKTCRMIVPIHGPQGEYFTSFEWIRSDWYLVPAVSKIDWETANAKEIIRAIDSESLDAVKVSEFNSLMRRFSSTYLD